MPSQTAETFMKALVDFEKSGDAGPLAAQFADDAELWNLALGEPLRGPEGARQFWQTYRAAFAEVRSTFIHVIEGAGGIVLEWESTGSLPGGSPVAYKGASVLEEADGKVKRFRTYYDSAAFVGPKKAEATK